ncbi:MAG TPA: UDP-glucose 4-epimerase GalE [Stellaceae bacterium]|jgi:UDP-glucose-4-epimerase GalE|nr:UDP-glucose 4-epimerase GalE [Stellaceae bacterium]
MSDAVLVTGGAGYIGSNACKALAKAGYKPIAYDNLSRGHRQSVRWGPLVEGDLSDRRRLDGVLADFRPVAVLHFAGYAYVAESMARPELYFRNNVVNSLNLFEALLRAGNPPVVFSSSCATYGIPDTTPIDETAPQRPVNPYGESKAMVERALASLDRAHGLRHVTLRYFNAAGADPDGEIGERHDPETHLIPLVLEAVLGRRDAVEIFGTDYPTPDGTAIRDYIHIQDLVEAHVRALDYLRAGGASVALNLGTGIGHSVRQVIEIAGQVTGRPVPYREAPRRSGDPPILVADARAAQRVLQWQAVLPKLDDIVAAAWRWRQKFSDWNF